MKLTFIGAGNMAEAIIAGTYKEHEVEVVARNQEVLDSLKDKYDVITTCLDDSFDIEDKNLILCVKPYALKDISIKLKGKANSLLSILAGTTLKSLKESIDANYYVRTMPNLKEIDIATAVAGSGPAFLALVAEALSDGAVKEGLKREDANILVKGLFDGFAPLLEKTHPALLKDAVMSPGGTTAAGYSALEESSVRDGFIKAITKAYEKAKELGK